LLATSRSGNALPSGRLEGPADRGARCLGMELVMSGRANAPRAWNRCAGDAHGVDVGNTMKDARIQSLRALREEMKAVARGARPAPRDAARPSFNSVEAIIRLLTPENRRLLALIRDRKPASIAELVEMTGRAQPNLTRTLAKLEAAGFVAMSVLGRRKAPSVVVKTGRRRNRPVFRQRYAARRVNRGAIDGERPRRRGSS